MSFTDTKVWTTSPVSKVREFELIISRSHSTDLKVAETFAHHDENTKLWLYGCITFHLKFTKYRVAIVREKSGKNENFSKSGNFFKKSGKIFDIVKVSEKSGNSVFWFIYFYKFSWRFWVVFSFGKDEKYAAKQAKQSIWHFTSDTCCSCGQWFSLWILSSKFLLLLSAKSGKKLKMKRKLFIMLYKVVLALESLS